MAPTQPRQPAVPPSPLRAGAAWARLSNARSGARGSLLAAMLVTLTIGAILLSVAASQWSFIVRRDREKELIFRGMQIVRGIEEWQARTNALPTSLEQMTKPPRPTLRRLWHDPMTARYEADGELVEGTGEWALITPGQATQGGASGASGASGPSGASGSAPRSSLSGGRTSGALVGPFVGVQSQSDEPAIGQWGNSGTDAKYSDWKFRVVGASGGSTGMQGVLELPRSPGFGGYRLPGGPPVTDTLRPQQPRGPTAPGPPRGDRPPSLRRR